MEGLPAGIALAPEGAIVTIKGFVDRHQPPPRGKRLRPYRVFIHDDTGELALTYFRTRVIGWRKPLPLARMSSSLARLNWFNGRPSMVHPDYAATVEYIDKLPLVERVYPMTAGLSPKALRKTIEAAVERLPDLPEWLDASLNGQTQLSLGQGELRASHHPRDAADLDLQAPARRRLAFDEFLAGQISLALVRQRLRKEGRHYGS